MFASGSLPGSGCTALFITSFDPFTGQNKAQNKDLNKEVPVPALSCAAMYSAMCNICVKLSSKPESCTNVRQVSKFARDAATTFAPRASGPSKNPAFKGAEHAQFSWSYCALFRLVLQHLC